MTIFLNEKNVNLTKQEQFFKGFAITYNVEILLSFDPEQTVQLKRNYKRYFLNLFIFKLR